MKVILFIGHHKTGSTSLQVFLSQNWLKLLRAGILYPSVENLGLAENLGRLSEGQDNTDPLPINVREPHNALAFRFIAEGGGLPVPAYHGALPKAAFMVQALRQQAARLAPHTIILCSEVFSNFAVDKRLIGRLYGIFPDAEMEIYCILRRPDQYLVSWHGQRLRFGHKVAALGDGGLQDYLGTGHFDYRKLIHPWIDRQRPPRLHLRDYAEVLAAGGTVRDFTARLGGFPEGLQDPAEHHNRSLPYALMEIARLANHRLSPDDARDLRGFLELAPVVGDLDLADNACIEMFGGTNRETMQQHFAPIHDYLSQLRGQAAFFADADEIGETREIPEAEATREALRQIDPELAASDKVGAFLRELKKEFGVA